MHNLMREADIPHSPACIYCGHRVNDRDWKEVWDGAQQYLEIDCPDCNKNIFFKTEVARIVNPQEKGTSPLEAQIEIIEHRNKEL